MNGIELMLKSTDVLHRSYMAWKFDRLLQKAEAHGLTEGELYNSDQRFALFMRVGRAFEICSERDVVDYISNAMIGGIQCGDADKRPDFAQMAISALNGVTKVELNILLIMRSRQIFVDTPKKGNSEENRNGFIEECHSVLNIEPEFLEAILNSLTRTGLVSSGDQVLSGFVPNSNKLTVLARELFRYVDYARRHTQ